MKKAKKVLSLVVAIIMVVSTMPLAYAEKTTLGVGDTIQFGSYPQSKVTNSETISELNSINLNWLSYEYYSSGMQSDYMKYADVLYNGEKYRGVRFSSYRPTSTYSMTGTEVIDETEFLQYMHGYRIDTTYWFKYEPIKWIVLDSESGLIMSDLVIDAQPFNNILSDSVYSTSSVRTWLNKDFLNDAFIEDQKAIINISNIDNNSDRIFLLSYDEILNSDYGFKNYGGAYDPLRTTISTKYARIQGLFNFSYGNYDENTVFWYLRTAYYNNAVWLITYKGIVGDYVQNVNSIGGIRPALRINIDELYKTETHNHNYTAVEVKATCNVSGTITYTCSCGDTYAETIPAKAHNFSNSRCTDCDYNKADNCTCKCHGNFIQRLIFKITNLFAKLFNPAKRVCDCGAKH